MTRINGWACFFLVSLRLAIGWHFFIEGLHKIHTHQIGKTATSKPGDRPVKPITINSVTIEKK